MIDPYRRPTALVPSAPRRRRCASVLGVAALVVWALGVSRLALAIERDEPVRGEPALAALLTVVPPIALLFGSVRELVWQDRADEDAIVDDDRDVG